MPLLDGQQPRGEESVSVLMIMAGMHAGGPGQVLMAITQHRKLPVEPGGNPPALLVEQEITRPDIAVDERDMIERRRIRVQTARGAVDQRQLLRSVLIPHAPPPRDLSHDARVGTNLGRLTPIQ